MAASRKVQVISTKYFMCINWGYYVIYLQNMKFVQLILWPGGAYTDKTYVTKSESRSHTRIHFMNHDYIGSFWQCQMSQKAQHQTALILNTRDFPFLCKEIVGYNIIYHVDAHRFICPWGQDHCQGQRQVTRLACLRGNECWSVFSLIYNICSN